MAKLFNEITKKEDIDYLISLKEKDINKSFMNNAFGDFGDGSRFEPYDVFEVPPMSYGIEGNKNQNAFRTTVGLWVYNKLFIEQELFNQFKYLNDGNYDGDFLNYLNTEMSYMLSENEITIDMHKRYLMKREFIMRYVAILSPNHTDKLLLSGDHMKAEKNRLIKENREELMKGNELVAAKIEKQLMDSAREYLGDDPSMDIYNSKSRSKFVNHYKNIFLMKGAIMSTDPDGGYDIATSSLMDGASKEEYHIFANSNVGGAFARAKNTQIGGYMVKQYLSAYQHVLLDKEGSDCKTKRFIEVKLTSKNIGNYMYNYVIEGSNLVEITRENRSKFIDKTVKIRFSSMCESEHICNKCMGNLYYRLGNVENVGMTTVKIPSRVMNWSLKRFHDAGVKIHKMDVMKAFGLK